MVSAITPAADGLAPTLCDAIARAGFAFPLDLLLHFPLRYEDWKNICPVNRLQHGGIAMVEGELVEVVTVPARGRAHLLAQLQDANGDIVTLRFFNVTPGLKSMLKIGHRLSARGKAAFNARNGWMIAHPRFSSNSDKRIRTIYPATKGLSSAQLQKLIHQVLAHIQLPALIPQSVDCFDGSDWSLKQALQAVHSPIADNSSPLPMEHPAWQRLRFEELVAHQIILRRRYHYRAAATATITLPADWQSRLNAALPFTLTAAQQRAIDDIRADMCRPYPMRRLLQGDVGSGKTVVAAAACIIAVTAGGTAALMAPTEILAEQHYQSLSALFDRLSIHCERITGAMTAKQRYNAEERLRFGISSLAIGTHALFQEQTLLPRLLLAVIDEQHRFGVEQRQSLVKKNNAVHQLMMSATPIPRTLALSLYADMDVSILDEKPQGRQLIRTIISSDARRGEIIQRVAAHIDRGGRVYWVCPLIENSEKLNLETVYSLSEKIAAAYPALKIGVLHGRMKAAEKKLIMEKFRDGDYQLLVATTVIEVGVDVAQADVMVIESADRMGLSQLHQLRGRVGRGHTQGVCLLIYSPPLSAEAAQRLRMLRDSNDGFEIARQDLAMRGPGEWLGSRQSGLPSLRVARLGKDEALISAARAAADWMLKHDKRGCVRHIQRWLGADYRRRLQPAGKSEGD